MMKHRLFILAVISAFTYQTVAIYARCPAGYPNEIFCDDFDTYCTGGGYPGAPNCSSGADDAKLQSVWYNTTLGGTTIKVETNAASILDGTYSGRYVAKSSSGLGLTTVRDWTQAGQILDFHRRIGEVHGSAYSAVIGSNAQPLSLTFELGANYGKLRYSPGYMELAFGAHTDIMNMANTDYVMWPNGTCCGYSMSMQWPMICAQGNPAGGMPPAAGCPSVSTNPPPVHNAIAVGSVPVLDIDRCDCWDTIHPPNPRNFYMSFYDGQVWWSLGLDDTAIGVNMPPGATVSGTGPTPLNGAPAVPPANYPARAQPGKFYLYCDEADTSIPFPSGASKRPEYLPLNIVTLSIKRDVARVELTSLVRCSEVDPHNSSVGLYYTYRVTSVMDNIPLKYTGPFDRLRAGFGTSCQLSSSASWTACANSRTGLVFPGGYFVDFDKVALFGGIGYTAQGACCNAADGTCTMKLQSECATQGRWTRPSQFCNETLCCPAIYGDHDHNGSVDMNDFAALQRCITAVGAIDPSCKCLDFDGSNSIDTDDIEHFSDCATGPDMPGNSAGDCKGREW